MGDQQIKLETSKLYDDFPMISDMIWGFGVEGEYLTRFDGG